VAQVSSGQDALTVTQPAVLKLDANVTECVSE